MPSMKDMTRLAAPGAALTFSAVALCAVPASAGTAVTEIASAAVPGQSIVFNDFTFSLVPTGSSADLNVGDPVLAYATIESLYTGASLPFLDTSFSNFGNDVNTGAANISIEAKLTGKVKSNNQTDTILLENVQVEVYLGDNQINDTVTNTTTAAQAEANFTNGLSAAQADFIFADADADDFYRIKYNSNGEAVSFTFALSITQNLTPIAIGNSALTSGADAAIFGFGSFDFQGVNNDIPVLVGDGGIFQQGSTAQFALAIIPAPSAAVAGVIGLAGLTLRRRR